MSENKPVYIKTLVIGGGLIGSAAAKYAAMQYGKDVVLLENGKFSSGSSRGFSRIVRLSTQKNELDLAGRAAQESVVVWKHDAQSFVPADCVFMSPNQAALQQSATDIPISPLSDITDRFPYFRKSTLNQVKVEHAISGTSGVMNPEEIVRKNIAVSRAYGARCLEEAGVTAIGYSQERTDKGEQKISVLLQDGSRYIADNLILAPGVWAATGAIRKFLEQQNGNSGKAILDNLKVKPAYLHFIPIPRHLEADLAHFPATIFKSADLVSSSGKIYPDGYMMKEVDPSGQHFLKVAFYGDKVELPPSEIEALRIEQNRTPSFMISHAQEIQANQSLMLDFLKTHFAGIASLIGAGGQNLHISHSVACPISYTADSLPLFGQLGEGHSNALLYIDSTGISGKQSDYIGKVLVQNMKDLSKEEKMQMRPTRRIGEHHAITTPVYDKAPLLARGA